MRVRGRCLVEVGWRSLNHCQPHPPRLYFEARHQGSTYTETEMGGITHPNQYFDQSMKFYSDIHGAVADGDGDASHPAEAAPVPLPAADDTTAGDGAAEPTTAKA